MRPKFLMFFLQCENGSNIWWGQHVQNQQINYNRVDSSNMSEYLSFFYDFVNLLP